MPPGALLTHASAAVAFLAYLLAVALQLRPASESAHTVQNRLAWTLAFLLLIVHVLCAFHFIHHWSHADAFAATARQTAALTGVNSGSGLWVNYALIAVWLLDLIWRWASPTSHQSRPRLVTISLHAFLAFIWFNATVIFGHGLIRWLSLIAWILLLLLYLLHRRQFRAQLKP
ncbi:MAG TPA: hypothetical protein VEI97_13235 [bacterium]|nr:hypothetical protein [bacterium]